VEKGKFVFICRIVLSSKSVSPLLINTVLF
jgi:hypothetical protein